jgi:hypothetical protein
MSERRPIRGLSVHAPAAVVVAHAVHTRIVRLNGREELQRLIQTHHRFGGRGDRLAALCEQPRRTWVGLAGTTREPILRLDQERVHAVVNLHENGSQLPIDAANRERIRATERRPQARRL